MVKVQSSRLNVGNFVIGVDGGGTKTAAALADLDGKIVARAVSGGSSVRDFGIELAAENVVKAIYDLIKRRKNIKIASVFIGLPAMEEEYKDKKPVIIRELKKHKKITQIFKGKVAIGSDQQVAFRAGSYAKDGVVAICGTGTAIHGWNGKKEFLADNQGWVSKGSAIWIGNKVMEAVAEDLDGRGQKTILSDLVFKKYKFKEINDLLKFLYMDSPADLPGLAPICDHAANRKDKIAQEILIAAGIEIARAVIAVAQRLDFDGQVPLVLVGGVYKSRWVADAAANEIERRYPNKFDFVFAADPVVGAVKLAIEVVK
ncbi:MAG: BadF/BadG/BcrA/BcrD ATPase family protein [Minisyncoccales bacterium]